MTGADPFAAALRYLIRRGHGEEELAQKLAAKGFSRSEIATALQRCRDLGYLDDRRFATERARALLRNGRAAGSRILFDLRRRGIPAETAAEALAEAEAVHPPAEELRRIVARRYPAFVFTAADDRERRRVVSYLVRRGFPLSLVLTILHDERNDR